VRALSINALLTRQCPCEAVHVFLNHGFLYMVMPWNVSQYRDRPSALKHAKAYLPHVTSVTAISHTDWYVFAMNISMMCEEKSRRIKNLN